MIELKQHLQEASSFAAIWLSTWLLLFFVLWALYPLCRRVLLKWHPATASNTLLTLLSLPFLVSLLSTILLFSPLLEQNLITAHFHGTDCESQFPRLQSAWAVGSVLGMTALALLSMLGKFIANVRASHSLRAKLSLLGDEHGEWCLLPNRENLVFTLGWLRNTIFITEGLLRQCSSADIDIILDHEKEHVSRRDNLRLLAGRLLLLVVPAPLVRRFNDDMHLFAEAACDFSTATRHGALNVAETLLRIHRLVPERFTCFNRNLASAFTGAEVEDRVLLLLEGDTAARPGKFRALLYLLLLLGLSLVLVDPLHHGVEWLL